MEYYVLGLVQQDTSTIYVPVSNEKLTSKMGNILTADEVHEFIRFMPDEEEIWISDNIERKNLQEHDKKWGIKGYYKSHIDLPQDPYGEGCQWQKALCIR